MDYPLLLLGGFFIDDIYLNREFAAENFVDCVFVCYKREIGFGFDGEGRGRWGEVGRRNERLIAFSARHLDRVLV
jgi:hypothetical protein